MNSCKSLIVFISFQIYWNFFKENPRLIMNLDLNIQYVNFWNLDQKVSHVLSPKAKFKEFQPWLKL